METVASATGPSASAEEEVEPQDPTGAVSAHELRRTLSFELAFAVVAGLCLFLVPSQHGFEPLAGLAVISFIVSCQIRLNVGRVYFSCSQVAFLLMLFTVPLNVLPVIVYVIYAVPRLIRGHESRSLGLAVAAVNSGYVIPPVLIIALATQSDPPTWSRWPIYVAAFTSEAVFNSVLFLGATYPLFRYRPELRLGLTGTAFDLLLTPIGLMVAIVGASEPVAAGVTMLSITGVLALLSREHDGRRAEADRALRDPMTGLPNRALFNEALESAERRCKRADVSAGLLFIDLDGFKEINDSLGHLSGDEVLVLFANRLRSAVRTADTPARLGGDEFAVILDGPMTPQSASALAAKVRDALEGPITLSSGEVVTARASIGYAVFDAEIPSTEAVSEADGRLYADKRKRKRVMA